MFGFENLKALTAAAVLAAGLGASASAIPTLQLGDGSTGDWSYDNATQTWVMTGSSGSVNAYANSDTAGANGSYAWDAAGAGSQTAYLIISAMPQSVGDVFDVTVENDGGALAMYTSGFGTPPAEDPNSIAPHGIFDTYFELYEFNFDGAELLISDQQPGGGGTGNGFMEAFNVTVNAYFGDATGIHFDLFTVSGDGILDLGIIDRRTVNAFAPFSHDAEFDGCCEREVPEPGPLGLLGLGMVAVYIARRRRQSL